MYFVEFDNGERDTLNGMLAKRLLIAEARAKAKEMRSEHFTVYKGWDRIVVPTTPTTPPKQSKQLTARPH